MRANSFEPSVIGRFFGTPKDQRTDLPYSQSGRPVLYLKYWGSDYPYLQGVGEQKRWLPVAMRSSPQSLTLLKEGH